MKRSEAVWQLAGYMSGMEGFTGRHPEELIPLADHAIKGLEAMGLLPQNPKGVNFTVGWTKEEEYDYDKLVKGII